MTTDGEPEQLALVPVAPAPPRKPATRARSRAPRADRPVARQLPVAVVVVDTPLTHLDRPFEYLVPEELDEAARPGVRVRVRFAGRDRDGFLLERRATPEHEGRLQLLRSVVSPQPVLTPQIAAAARQVADHYGGTLSDVLRLAIPPRHARAERSVPDQEPDQEERPSSGGRRLDSQVRAADVPAAWAPYPAGGALLRRLTAGQAPWAAWSALPGQPPQTDWPRAVAEAVRATLDGGRGALVILPDHRDVVRLLPVIAELVGEESCAQLTADLGPEARYRAFVRVLRGQARVVVGTRSAAWAPVRELGLIVCWDDGDDLHSEPRAPYPHVREVARTRARVHRAGLLMGGLSRSVPVQAWVDAGELAEVSPAPSVLREAVPRVVVAGEGHQLDRDPAARSARIPSVAWRALKAGLAEGPVLVQVPRVGYVVSLACADCRTPVRCARCSGPVGLAGASALHTPTCRWCAAPGEPGTICPTCGSTRHRAGALGQQRTAEELGRAFPGARVLASGGQQVLAQVAAEPALVVATPGAEPWVPGGYRAVALLDGWALVDRAGLDAGAEALRRWVTAAGLASPGAPVLVCGVGAHAGIAPVEALARWNPAWLAQRELEERRELELPPVRRHVALSGAPAAVVAACTELVGRGHRQLGEPRAMNDQEVVAVVREGAGQLPVDVHALMAARSAVKDAESLRLMLDPGDALL